MRNAGPDHPSHGARTSGWIEATPSPPPLQDPESRLKGNGADPGRQALDAARLWALTRARSCAVELDPKLNTSVDPSRIPRGDAMTSRSFAANETAPRLANPSPGAGCARPKSEETRGRIRPTAPSVRTRMVGPRVPPPSTRCACALFAVPPRQISVPLPSLLGGPFAWAFGPCSFVCGACAFVDACRSRSPRRGWSP